MKAVCAAACIGIAAWCSFGAVGIAGASSVSARIALLPPWWLLPILVAAAWVAVRACRFSSAQLSPLFVSALVVLPWLPIPVPSVALLWTGGLIPLVWVAVVVGAISTRSGGIKQRWMTDPRRAPVVVAAISIVVYGMVSWWLSPRLPGGDEPHYLVITQSLLKDGDLRIENNHQRGDYLKYFSGELKPDYLRRGRDGAIYSIHAPGLPALILPAFWLLGYPGTLAFLALVSACGAALVWRIGYLATGNAGAAWFGWVSSALTTPFVFLATQIFPDGIGATAVLLGMLPLLDPKATRWSWLISSLALSTLPWLHTRFAILSGLAGIFVAMSLRSPRRIVAFLVLPALSAAAWFGHFFLIYGTFNPSAPYGHYTQTAVSNLVRGIPGLLFDQQFGLIVAAPVYAFILGGLIWGAVGGHRWTWTIVAVSLPYVAAVGMFQMWWGGSSVPARFLTPLCLLLGVAAARLWHEWRLPFTRAAACSLLAVSLFISAVLLIPGHGQLLFNSRDGFALWLEWVNDVVDLPRALPSLFRDSPLRAWLKAGLWVMSASAGWGLLRVMTSRINRRESVREPAWMLPWLFAGSAMLACSLVWRVDHVQPLTPETGVTALLMRVDPEFRSLAYDYATHGFETPRTLLTKLRLQPSTRRPADSRGPIFGVSRFPAGAHRLHVVTSKAVEGTIVLRVGRSSPPLDVWTLKEAHAGSFSRPLRLPVEVQSLYVEAEDHLRGSIASVSLQPWAGEDVLAPVTRRSADRAVRYDMATIYFLDRGAFPEASGFWVSGSDQARVVVSNYGAPLRVFLRNAPVENTIAVVVDGDRREAGLHPGEETTLVIPRRRATPDVVVGIQTTSGFRPSETEPGSTDVRYLGCWVEIR